MAAITGKDDLLLGAKLWLKSRLSGGSREALSRLREPLGFAFRTNLPKLATIYGTDKWGSHWYATHYATHFRHLRRKKLVVFEIGIGGYDNPRDGGGSLRMWRRYFPNAQIIGLDIFDKTPHAEKRIHVYRGDQSDPELLNKIVSEVGRPDIIIDDGSHLNKHVIKSFEILFPLLKDDGIYAVEDTQTAYWPDAGGSSDGNLTDLSTSMNLFKSLVDCLNYEELIKPGYAPTYYDLNIIGMHFYHNLVFIQKGRNAEGSNFVKDNQAT
jgi:hypothetical protein